MQKNYNPYQPNKSLRFILTLLVLLSTAVGFSQTVSVNNGQSAQSLVDMLLSDACGEISNSSSSSVEATGSFTNGGGAFPLADGVIIRTGNAGFSSGSYTGNNLNSSLNNVQDPYLQNLLDNSGRDALIEETSFLEFNFVPVSNFLSFDFLLASNEFGAEQCVSSDVLAFVLTDLQTGTQQNLAVIPGSNTPVSVQNIKDNTYNQVCPSVNSDLFESYEVTNPRSTLNMRGYTSVLTAASNNLIPGREYNIRIVVGDANDSRYDSAIFLSAGSFNTGVNLGADFSICGGESTVLESGLDDPAYTYRWLRDGAVIPGATNPNLTVNTAGTYRVEVTRGGSNCLLEDEIVVSNLEVTEPQDLTQCFNTGGPTQFNLTLNDAAALGVADDNFEVVYYDSQASLDNNNPIPDAQRIAYPSTGNETIFVKLRNAQTGFSCGGQYEFQLNVSEEIVVTPPPTLEICLLPGENGAVDLSNSIPTFPEEVDSTQYEVSYYNARRNAQDGLDAIDTTQAYTVPAGTRLRIIYLRIAPVANPDCFVIESFNITVGALPPVDTMENVVTCGSYTLPELENGQYYTQPGGQGELIEANTVLDSAFTQTIFIYNESADGCPSEPSSFEVTLTDKFEFETTAGCETQFTLPELPLGAGAFYTAPDGPNGSGTEFEPEEALGESQTVYYYAEVDGNVCFNDGFEIELDPLPPVDRPEEEIVCESYTLPELTNGSYNTQSDGDGEVLEAGAVIDSTQTIYIYNNDEETDCANNYALEIFIVPERSYFENYGDGLSVCGAYNLPPITKGAYYTEALGAGDTIPRNEPLLADEEVFYFVQTTSGENCTENLSFNVEVRPIPPVDSLPDVVQCVSDPAYVLPELENGQFFTRANRSGAQLFPGDSISNTQTIYISNEVEGCLSESTSFTVTVRPLPSLENLVPSYSCDVYELPEISDGAFYTAMDGPNGEGEEVPAGTLIDTTTTLYLYREYPDLLGCINQRAFTINIIGSEVGEFDDVVACDGYVLPALEVGNYYTSARGRGQRLQAGEVIRETQEIFVYNRNGTRFICEDEASFTVTISETPVIEPTNDVEACGSYTLPNLNNSEFDFGYYRSPGGVDPIAAGDYTFDTPGTYTIYRYATAKNNTACNDEDIFTITVYPLLDFEVQGGTICTDAITGETIQPFLLESGIDPAEYNVNWSLNGEIVFTGSSYEAVQAGIYTVTTEKLTEEVGAACNYNPTTVEVLASSQPELSGSVNEPFADVSVITVEVTSGDGEYEYQMDGGPYQASNEFYDVQPGRHELSARGVTGNCSSTTIVVNVINYPKFFTPNADGYNDVWNIDPLQEYEDAQIEIFDRYGKLLKTIFPKGNGWDGTYRGQQMPSDDYWFVIRYTDLDGMPIEFKAHFTLKR